MDSILLFCYLAFAFNSLLKWHSYSSQIIADWGGFPGGSEFKAFACKAGDPGSIPGSGKIPWDNPMDGGAW